MDGWTIPEGYRPDNTGRCRSCGAPVLWVITAAGKKMPLNRDGTSHFANCPEADKWRKK
jgi:hypothetical protein